MYRVQLCCDSLGRDVWSSLCIVERPNLQDALFRLTSYLEAEVLGRWFDATGEPRFLATNFRVEVAHVAR